MASLLSALFLLLGSSAIASPSSQKCQAALAGPATLTHLQSLIQLCKPKTPDEFVALLPEELRKNFTLVYSSGSPERAATSAAFPRTILYSNDGKLFLAFTGDPAFPEHANRVQFYQSNGASRPATIGEMVWNKQGKVSSHTGPNDTKSCRYCHQQDPKLIWSQYQNWPGFYGSADDLLITGTKEDTDFKAFVASIPNGPARYRSLIFPATSAAPPQTGNKRSTFLPPFLESEYDFKLTDPDFRHNTIAMAFASRVDAIRDARILRKSSRFADLKDLMLWAGFNCQYRSQVHELQSGDSLHFATNRVAQAFERQITELNRSGKLSTPLVVDKKTAPGGGKADGTVEYSFPLAPILENLGFESPAAFTPGMADKSYYFDAGFDPMNTLVTAQLIQSDPALSGSFEPAPKFGAKAYAKQTTFGEKGRQVDEMIPTPGSMEVYPKTCQIIADRILAKYPASDPSCATPTPATIQTQPIHDLAAAAALIAKPRNPTQNRCAICHTSMGPSLTGAPPIPFDDVEKLRAYVKSNPGWDKEVLRRLKSSGRDHMPITTYLTSFTSADGGYEISSDSDLGEIRDFIESLKH